MIDADARLLWRFPPRRLAAEEIRDTMLLLAGKLDERRGGPGFRLYEYTRDNVATYTPLENVRSRNLSPSGLSPKCPRVARSICLSDFDAPDCAFLDFARRIPTTTPSQALALMNHSFTMRWPMRLAERLSKAAGADNPDSQMQAGVQAGVWPRSEF